MPTRLPTVIWVISLFDSRSPSPLPLKNRSLVLDWKALNEEQVRECLEILRDRDTQLPNPSSFTSTVMSISRNTIQPDERMLRFRSFFNERELEASDSEPTRYVTVSLNREYMEDESGAEISMYQIMQHMTGQEYPIIAGDPDSVLRLPPALPNPKSWSEESANTIAQFLEVVVLIHASEWIRCTPRLTHELQTSENSNAVTTGDPAKLLESIVPDVRETQSVLAYFRQLHAKDKLFIRTCDAFVAACRDSARNQWIEEQKHSFNTMIDSKENPFCSGYSPREVIAMFMYGAGLLHSEANRGADKDLFDFIQKDGIYRVRSAFNNCLWDILSYATVSYHVIKRDFNHWITECKLAAPTRVSIPDLFKNVEADSGSDR